MYCMECMILFIFSLQASQEFFFQWDRFMTLYKKNNVFRTKRLGRNSNPDKKLILQWHYWLKKSKYWCILECYYNAHNVLFIINRWCFKAEFKKIKHLYRSFRGRHWWTSFFSFYSKQPSFVDNCVTTSSFDSWKSIRTNSSIHLVIVLIFLSFTGVRLSPTSRPTFSIGQRRPWSRMWSQRTRDLMTEQHVAL